MRPLLSISCCLLLLTACGGKGDESDTGGSTGSGGNTTGSSTTTGTDATSTGDEPGTTAPTTGTPTTDPQTTTGATTGEPDTTTSTTTTTDATTGDTSTGEPVACPPDFFCDDFEAHPEGLPPGAPWTPDIGDGSANVEAGKAVSGTHAVHLKTGNAYGGRALLGLAVPEVFPTTHLFGRMRMWLTEASPSGVHWTMIEADGPTQVDGIHNNEPFKALLRYGGQQEKRLMANYETWDVGSDCWHHSEQTIPEGVWACMEWEFDSDNSTMRFWLDGNEVADLTVGAMGQGCVKHETQDQWYYPTMEHLSLGWVDYQEGGGRDLWIDDVAVGPTRVGCE